jgi:non-ribosomal peptide synthetase component F
MADILTLSFGGQLILARPGGHQDPAYLVKVITEQQITIAGLVPSIIRVLLEEKGIENCTRLRHVTSGGEGLGVEFIDRFVERLNLHMFCSIAMVQQKVASM